MAFSIMIDSMPARHAVAMGCYSHPESKIGFDILHENGDEIRPGFSRMLQLGGMSWIVDAVERLGCGWTSSWHGQRRGK